MATRVLAATLAIALGLGFWPTATSAQDAVSCDTIEPREAAFFEELADSPRATPAQEGDEQDAGEATPVTFELPEGEIADEATIGEITTLYETLIACLNAADYLRAYALYTDDYLLRNLSAEAIGLLEATPAPVDESTQSTFGGVLEATQVDDGRVVALVTTDNPISGVVTIRATLVREEAGLRILDEAVLDAAGTATPAG